MLTSAFFVIDSEAGAGEATCENGEHLPFIAVVAAYIALSIKHFVTRSKKVGYEINPGGTIST